MPKSYIQDILSANVYDVAIETPLQPARNLSRRIGNQILIKREDMQPVFSFKLRGAYNKMRQLTDEQREQGIVAASAGNHAQGVALSAQYLGCKATIVMPRTTPAIKVNAVKGWGAKVVLHGDTYDEASAHAFSLVEEKGMTYVHPYDDRQVIAGQGTIGVEILRQNPGPLDIVFVPVGGGGLAAGVAAYIKYVRPEVKIIAVEPEDAACLKAAIAANKRVTLPEVGIFADGVAVGQIGKETYRVLKETVDEVITASTDEMCAAIKDIFEDTRSIAEPAGALSLAGLKKYVAEHGLEGQTLVAIESGANTNFDRIRYFSERTQLGEKSEAILAVEIPEKPGSFKTFCSILGKRSITEFNYRFSDNKAAQIFVGMQVKDADDRQTIIDKLVNKGYSVEDMTLNEIAKEHVRHMVGGIAPSINDEVVYTFTFPERPGALMNFLDRLGQRWNISMFHYRNHGAAYGRVLVGLQVAEGERDQIAPVFDELGYRYDEETDNTAYQTFLKA
ncbi:L-threonine dehydratase biosynthetic IlvA [BD1-7 clade bacterium]|uniref:L-threonine dehydratase n=1 Tax=BD1-7 clade bacterium TaxID=2029982 RepID=A0A5S9QCE2_9GAMM|nr:L-threonine dehydratase biosynthetic IlvA [BD1-7 clade bacterium]